MNNILDEINKKGISSINGLALVSKSSYEVVFYGKINGRLLQSNNMIEEGLIDSVFLDKVYAEIVEFVKNSESYNMEKLNIITFNNSGITSFSQKDRNCSLFSIKKEWKKTIIG